MAPVTRALTSPKAVLRNTPKEYIYFDHPQHRNRGVCFSRNLGVKQATGDYVALLDADDVWLPHKLERQLAILRAHPTAGLVFGVSQYWVSWTGEPEIGTTPCLL